MKYIVVVLLSLFLIGCAHAHHTSSGYGRVIGYEPIGRDVYTHVPNQRRYVCSPSRQVYHRNDRTGMIVGAIGGAALGNRIGGGSGRDIATAAGAVIGGHIGSDYNRGRSYTHGQHCYWTNVHAARVHHVIDYFLVQVEDQGRVYTIRMNHPPRIGTYIRY